VADYPALHPFALTNIEVWSASFAPQGYRGHRALRPSHARLVAGALFFLIAIAPTLGIIRYTSSVAANRSLYLPFFGLLLPLAWG